MCTSCNADVPRADFSASQFKKPRGVPRVCRACQKVETVNPRDRMALGFLVGMIVAGFVGVCAGKNRKSGV